MEPPAPLDLVRVCILGSGGSGGVPLITGDWGRCDPDNPKNRRQRSSLLVERGDTRVLIDASPDLRAQLLDVGGVRRLDAALITHAHADHCHGLDDLRAITHGMDRALDVYADETTHVVLKRRFGYAFTDGRAAQSYRPALHAVTVTGRLRIGSLEFTPIQQRHGHMSSLGFRFGSMAYCPDVSGFDEQELAKLQGLDTWIVDCLREAEHPTHAHLARALAWIADVKPRRAVLTHLNHQADFETISAQCPPGVELAYDGMILNAPAHAPDRAG